MNADRFTIKSQEALQAAQRLAEERHNPQTRPEHLLAVLLEQDAGVVAPVLRKLGVDPAAVRATLAPALDALPRITGAASEATGGSGELLAVVRAAENEMRELNDEYVSTEHLILALSAQPARPATLCGRSARLAKIFCRRSRRSAAAIGSPTRVPRTSTRHWRSTAGI